MIKNNKNGGGEGGGTEDIAKPGYSTCNRCSKQDENLEKQKISFDVTDDMYNILKSQDVNIR